MTFLAALLVATLAIVSCEVTQMMELTPAFYAPDCDTSLWCQDRETAERCDKVSYCTKWIWNEVPLQEVGNTVCDDCKEALTFFFKHNKTIINFVCGSLPIVAGVCESLFEDLIKNRTATEVCTDLDLCQKSSQATPPLLSGETCSECKQTALYLRNNAQSIQNYLTDFFEKTEFKIMSETFVEYFNEFLMKYDSTEMCEKFDLCEAQLILGADLCTRGPGYWCESLDNAKECGAFDFCQKKVWV